MSIFRHVNGRRLFRSRTLGTRGDVYCLPVLVGCQYSDRLFEAEKAPAGSPTNPHGAALIMRAKITRSFMDDVTHPGCHEGTHGSNCVLLIMSIFLWAASA